MAVISCAALVANKLEKARQFFDDFLIPAE